MADEHEEEVSMSLPVTPRLEPSFGEVARQEFNATARAFFAPVVGTVTIMRALVREVSKQDKAARRNDAA